MDTTALGVVAAKAMDGLEAFSRSGDIPEGAKIAACYIVCALDTPTAEDEEERELLRDVSTQVFVWGVPEEVYVQLGVLTMGLDNTSRRDD